MKSVSLPALLALGSAGVAWAEPAWTALPTEAGEDVVFADIHHGFYGTGEGKLYRTQDGGRTWEGIWSQPGLRSLAFLDASRGFLGADTLHETRDGGLTWHPADIGATAVPDIRSIDIAQPDCIHAAGQAKLLRSETRGQSWRLIDLSDRLDLITEVKFTAPDSGIVLGARGDNALVLRTGDGGLTWREVYRAKKEAGSAGAASFPTPLIGYAILGRRIARTLDGGESWIDLPLVEAGQAIGFLTPDKGWINGFETEDGGKSWKPSALAKSANRIRTSSADGTPMVYAIGSEVQIYR
ncbi:MAG TPA: hypothetical protein VKP60_15810 [Magnetospirillaceae bacterium]|nr:hypothetical protein [Magnetospirillaceae bacterium]